MNNVVLQDVNTASLILALEPDDVSVFVRKCIKNRSLSKLVTELNEMVLTGTRDEIDEARRALQHLGFV